VAKGCNSDLKSRHQRYKKKSRFLADFVQNELSEAGEALKQICKMSKEIAEVLTVLTLCQRP
jgi:hypothetical protein